MEKLMLKIMSVSFAPIIALNIFGGVIGAIWLFVLGEWSLVISALVLSIIFPFAYAIITIYQMPLMALLVYLTKKKKKLLAGLLGFVNLFITDGIDLAWVFLVFIYATAFSEGRNAVPYLLYGWEIAVGPFQFMASKEPPDSIGSYAAVYLIQISYLILATFFFLGILPFALPLIIVLVVVKEIYLLKIGFRLEKLEEEALKDSL